MSSISAVGGWRSDYRILSVIGVGHFISHFYYMALVPLFIHLRDAFGASYAELGLMLAVMSGASAVVQVPLGFMVDRYGARIVLALGLAICATATGLIGLADQFWMVVLLAFVAGVGNAVFHPADYAILNSSISGDRMGRAFSIHTFAGHLGTAAAPVTMIALTQWLGWRTAVMVAAAAGFVVLIFILSQWSTMREQGAAPSKVKRTGDRATPAAKSADGLSVIFAPQMLLFFAFFTLIAIMQGGMQTFVATALVALHSTPLTTATTALSVFLFCNAGGILLGGEISDRTTRHNALTVAFFTLTAALCILLAVVDLQAVVLMAVMAVIGIGQGITRPARDMMLRAAAPSGSVGKVFGFVTSGIAVGAALAPIPFGYLLDIGRPGWVFYLIAIILMLAILTLYKPRQATAGTARA